MTHNFLSVSRPSTKSLIRVRYKKSLQKIRAFGCNARRKRRGARSNSLEERLLVVILKHVGRLSGKHFIDDACERPPVDGFSVSFSVDDFWRKILRGAAHGLRIRVSRNVSLREPEVRELCVAILANQYIFRFQVSINDIVLVQVSEC